MTHLRVWVLMVGSVVALSALIGCFPPLTALTPESNPGAAKGQTAGGGTVTSPPVSERSSIPADPDEPAVKKFVEQVIAARMRGDAERLKKMLQPPLAANIQELRPRPMDFEIRSVEVYSRSARAKVWQRDNALDPQDNQALITYELVRMQDGWRIAATRYEPYFDFHHPQQESKL